MNFTYDPLTDDAAEAERRAQLRAPNCRTRRFGDLRQKAFAQVVLGVGAVAALAAGFNGALGLAGVAGLVALGGAVWLIDITLHDESAQNAREDIERAFAVPNDDGLKYLLEMKEKYHEIHAAIRRWNSNGLTIRNRDVCAVRAWVYKVEPVRRRERLLRQLES